MKKLDAKFSVCLAVAAPVLAAFFFAANSCSTAYCKSTEASKQDSFAAAFERVPSRMKEMDSPAARALLEKFHPRVFIAPDSYPPISFYRDYLPRSVVRSRAQSGRVVYKKVDAELLARIASNEDLYLDYRLDHKDALRLRPPRVVPTLYARAYRDVLRRQGRERKLIFLKYSAVFAYSGLPDGLGWFKKITTGILGNRLAWHELDIHGAVHVILDEKGARPLGVILAQHNHHRVLLAGVDFRWPRDNRVMISYARFSNEPYLIDAKHTRASERTVGDPRDIAYVLGRDTSQPLTGGRDIVVGPRGGAVPIRTRLRRLSPRDPLYTARMALGDRGKLLGIWEAWYRTGPPGMDYYTLPGLKNLADLTAFWYLDPGDDRVFALMKKHISSFEKHDVEPVLRHQLPRLWKRLGARHD